jgi:hypothetical protein
VKTENNEVIGKIVKIMKMSKNHGNILKIANSETNIMFVDETFKVE